MSPAGAIHLKDKVEFRDLLSNGEYGSRMKGEVAGPKNKLIRMSFLKVGMSVEMENTPEDHGPLTACLHSARGH